MPWNELISPAVTVAALGIIGLIIKWIGPWRKQITDEEAMYRADLRADNQAQGARIDKLERLLRRQEARHNAERSLDRHRIANVNSVVDSALSMLAVAPDRVPQILQELRAMRQRHAEAEALESATIRAAEIEAEEAESEAEAIMQEIMQHESA